MKTMRRHFRVPLGFLVVIAVAIVMGFSEARALDLNYKRMTVAFHGYFESNVILRDTSGFQSGFMNDVETIQQRNTLKFDVDVDPGFRLGPVSLEKFHFTYRGAYDTIFDIRDEKYAQIRRQGGPSRFDLGRDDIQYENDLREAFFDLLYAGELGTLLLRPGKQIVSWGEALGIPMIDVINPPDNSFQMFFLNPDDLKIPLWMVRLNYNFPPMGFVYLNLEGLMIPEIRPAQFGPLDQSMDAPYVSITPFSMLPENGVENVRYDVRTDDWAFGVKLTGTVGTNLSISAVYLKALGYVPGLTLTDFAFDPSQPIPFVPRTALVSFLMTETYGGYFSYYIGRPLDIVLKGEFARTNNLPVALPESAPDITFGSEFFGLLPSKITTFRMKPVIKWMLGFDKDLRWRWFSNTNISFFFQWQHTKYGEWEELFNESAIPKDTDLFLGAISWFWFHGKINPTIQLMADTKEAFFNQVSVAWTISKNWYFKVAAQSFWGDRNSKSEFATFIDTSELTFKFGFQW